VTVLNSSFLFLLLFASAELGVPGGAFAAEAATETRAIASLEEELQSAIRSARGRDTESSQSLLLGDEEGEQLERLFERTLQASRVEDSRLADSGFAELVEPWSASGFDLGRLQAGVWLLREAEGQKRGRGVYAFRTPSAEESPSEYLLAAPHALPSDDQRTGEVVAAMFSRSATHVAAWSTVPRREVDWTHTEETPFQRLTEAYVSVFPAGTVLQIHGFAQSKRKTERGRGASVILSNGTDAPDERLERRARCAEPSFSPVYVYPELRELGATKNTQGVAMRKSGLGRFLHVELSFDVRQRLVAENEPLDELVRCLLEVS